MSMVSPTATPAPQPQKPPVLHHHLIPVVAVMFAMAAATAIFAWILWPKDSDVDMSSTKMNLKGNVNVEQVFTTNSNSDGNVNAAVNENTSGNSNVNASADPMKDWKIYTSEKYGITFKYPSDWTVNEGATTTPYKIDVYPKTSDGWSTASAITFWVVSPYSMRCGEDPVAVTSSATIGGMTGTLYSVTDKRVKSCVYKHYNLHISPAGWGENPEINVVADSRGAYTTQDQILATLKLTDPTAGWKTYTNTAYGYSFKYPPLWKLVEYAYSAENPLSGDMVAVKDPADAVHELLICPDNRGTDCPPSQDAEYSSTDATDTIGGRSVLVKSHTLISIDCTSCSPKIKAYNFNTRPTGWKGSTNFGTNRDILSRAASNGSFTVNDQILFTFTFTK